MHLEYFNVRFSCDDHMPSWPANFAIVTAYATTGEKWTDDENRSADRNLEDLLRKRCSWVRRVTGFSAESGHAEPGWGAELQFDEACDIGLQFKQDAIYFVKDDELFVSHCDDRRGLVKVGVFSEMIAV